MTYCLFFLAIELFFFVLITGREKDIRTLHNARFDSRKQLSRFFSRCAYCQFSGANLFRVLNFISFIFRNCDTTFLHIDQSKNIDDFPLDFVEMNERVTWEDFRSEHAL